MEHRLALDLRERDVQYVRRVILGIRHRDLGECLVACESFYKIGAKLLGPCDVLTARCERESHRLAECGDSGHGALAALLANENVDVLICGGIGAGAINALKAANIKVIGGASGNVRQAAENYLKGSLKVRLNFFCNHHHDHGEGHTCGDHGCGSNKCSH